MFKKMAYLSRFKAKICADLPMVLAA